MRHTHCHIGLGVDKSEGEGGVEGIFMAMWGKGSVGSEQKGRICLLLLFLLEPCTSLMALRSEV